MPEKESEKGFLHNLFGQHLCDGCKGVMVFAVIAPTRRDVTAFAETFSRRQKQVDADGHELANDATVWSGSSGSERDRQRYTNVDTILNTLSEDDRKELYRRLSEKKVATG